MWFWRIKPDSPEAAVGPKVLALTEKVRVERLSQLLTAIERAVQRGVAQAFGGR